MEPPGSIRLLSDRLRPSMPYCIRDTIEHRISCREPVVASPSYRVESESGSRSASLRPRVEDGDEVSPTPASSERRDGAMCSAPDQNKPDEALMEKIREGRRGALGTLMERYWSPLVGYAAGIVGGRDPAKDVVQEAFIRVWQKREEWSSGGSAGAYLYRIVRNLGLNARRDRKTSSRRHDECGKMRARHAPPRTPAEALTAESLRAEVEAAIDALPERRREVFVLSRFHGLTHREIAEAMGISPQTVSNQMTAALSELRDALRHHLSAG